MIVSLVFTTFAATTLAKGPLECSFDDAAVIRQYHGVEGQQLIFNLSNKTDTEIMLTKDGRYRILKRDRYGTALLDDKYGNRFEQIQISKFNVGNATKEDSGEYLLEEFRFTDGQMTKTVKVRLNIHAPVSKPALSQMCFSPASSAVTCSSEGDEVEFLLTLDGHLLMQTKDHGQLISDSTDDNPNVPTVSTVSMGIHGQLTGKLLCQVGNKVSSNETSFHLTACTDAISTFATEAVMTRVIFCVLLLVLNVFLGIKLFYKKKSHTTNKQDDQYESVDSAIRMTQLQ